MPRSFPHRSSNATKPPGSVCPLHYSLRLVGFLARRSCPGGVVRGLLRCTLYLFTVSAHGKMGAGKGQGQGGGRYLQHQLHRHRSLPRRRNHLAPHRSPCSGLVCVETL